jgi:iron(III) transport system substrate-binding protein
MKQGKPVEMICPDQEQDGVGCLILPNAVVFIKGAPHPENAKKLIDYLLSRETEKKLAYADCAQIPLHQGVETPVYVLKVEKINIMRIDYAKVAGKLREIQPLFKEWVGY